jgi:hypothetical protein
MAEETMKNHLRWLSSNGMVCNTDKTEVMITNHNTPEKIVVDGYELQSQCEMKVLGIIFDTSLSWAPQVNNAISKSNRTLHGLRLIRNHLTKEQAKQVLTSFYFAVLNYGLEIWFHKQLSSNLKQKIRSCHYRAIRLILGPNSKMMHRADIDIISQRAPPDELSDFAIAKLAARMIQNRMPNRLHDTVLANSYSQSRQPGRLFFFDSSKKKIGRQCFGNRLATITKQMNFEWTQCSEHCLRTSLKKSFFTYVIFEFIKVNSRIKLFLAQIY